MARIVDLSQEIYEGMPVYAGHLETAVWQHVNHEQTAPNFKSGFSSQSLGLTMCDHGPTHVDAISHLDPSEDAPRIDEMPLDTFWGEGICLDVSDVAPREYIDAERLSEHHPKIFGVTPPVRTIRSIRITPCTCTAVARA